MFELDLLNLNGDNRSSVAASVSPYSIPLEGFDMSGPSRQYTWTEVDHSPGSSLVGDAPMSNVERTIPIQVRARFSSALTNVLTNPRPYSVVTGWATQGTGSTVTYTTLNFEPVISVVTTGSASSGAKHNFTGTVAAYSGGVWVKTASSTAPINVLFDGETATSITATTSWQFVKTENKTLTAATRSLQILQSDTGSRTFYVKLAGVHLGSTYAGYFDGACGDARWTGTAHASTSTAITSQDAINRAIGVLGEKGRKAIDTARTGGLTCYWLPQNTSYRSQLSIRAVDVSKVDYDYMHGATRLAKAEVKLTAHPYCLGEEYTAGTATKKIGTGALEMTATSVKGDIPGPCRLVATPGANKNQQFCAYGIQARDYSSGNALILGATSMSTTGHSGSSTAAATCVQTLTKTGTISGGTWPLSWEGFTFSASFAHNASTATVQSAIDAQLGAGYITVSGNPLSTGNMIFTFADTLASQAIPAMTFSTASLTGGGSVALSTTTAGLPAYISSSLYSDWTTICDTGNLTHTGDYRVFARVYDASAATDQYDASLRLTWGTGDLSSTVTNDPVSPPVVGDYSLVNFGQVHIPPVATGTQRWTGKIEGKTAGTQGSSSTVRIVSLYFIPMESGSGEVRSVTPSTATLSMIDVFGATSGVLTGDTSTSGHTWASMGGHVDANDFTETAAPDNAVIRTDVSDTSTNIAYGRGVILGTATPTNVDVAVSASCTANGATAGLYQGVIARFTDNDNFVTATFTVGGVVGVQKIVGGAVTALGSTSFAGATNQAYRIALRVMASGAWSVKINGATVISGVDSALATGGTLASGKSGMIDWQVNSTVNTRTYTNFRVSTPVAEQVAMYASQDLQFRTNEILREDSAGSGIYSVPAITRQPYQPELTPCGADGLTNRLLILTSRSNPDLGPDTLSDAVTVTAYHTPVYLLARSEA